jgi:hypothetical protein
MKNLIAQKRNGGYAMLTAVVLFLISSMTIVLAVSASVYREVKGAHDLVRSKESYFLAEAGMEDVLYRVKNGETVSSPESLTLDGFTVTTEIITASDSRTITSESDRDGYVRRVETTLETGAGAAFNYGIQTGNGGFVMDNNARVEGNIYSNGDIVGGTVTGGAIAANSSALAADQTNDSPIPPTSSITYRTGSSAQDLAQSFQPGSSERFNKIEMYLKKNGNPTSAITVRIVEDSSGSPGNTTLTTGSLAASSIGSSYGWVSVQDFSPSINLTAGATYWIVLDDSGSSASHNYTVGANTTYATGVAKLGQYGGSWNNTSPSGLDAYFKVYTGGFTATINDVEVGTAGVGEARAHTVTNSTIAGNLYCQVGSGNNKSCNTSLPDPTPQNFPISDSNIAQWKADAAAGTIINGDYTVSSPVSIGPAKINGDLTISDTLTMTGAIWVTGDIQIDNGQTVKMASSFGSDDTVLVADGNVNIENNANFLGSGTSGSYILLLTTSNCPTDPSCGSTYALEVANNAGAVVLNAQKGTLHFKNNSGAKEATAYKVVMDNGAVIVYESGLASMNFVSGPSGGWNIYTWKEVE